MGKDYYQILGVNKTAKADEIKQAFRKKAHEHHPDKAGGNAEKFKEINEAYQVLSNEERRKKYDQFGTTFENMGGRQAYDAGFDWSDLFRQGGARGQGFRSSNVNFDFSDLGDIFGDFFNQSQRANHRGETGGQRGRDLEVNIAIAFAEAVFGAEKTLDITKQVECQACQGSGLEPGSKLVNCKSCAGRGQTVVNQQTFFGTFQSVVTCQVCQGSGKVPEKKCRQCDGKGHVKGKDRVKISIPAGVDSGTTLRLSGQGDAGSSSAAGDLYVNLTVLPHPVFTRQGDQLQTNKTINFSQAVLGDKIRIKTLDGEVDLKIPAGTKPKQQFILRGQGAHRLRGHGRGDLIVTVDVVVPNNLSKNQRKIVEDLRQAGM